MPPRSSNRLAKKSTPKSKRQQLSAAVDEEDNIVLSEPLDPTSSSVVFDSPTIQTLAESRYQNSNNELPNDLLEENVSFLEDEDYLNMNGEGIAKEETFVGDDSNLDSVIHENVHSECEDSLEKREVETEENSDEDDQNNQDADSYLVEEESPAVQCEVMTVLVDNDTGPGIKKVLDMEGEVERSENREDDEEYNKDTGRDECIVLEDDNNDYIEEGDDMDESGEKYEDREENEDEKEEEEEEEEEEEDVDEDNRGDENILEGDADDIPDIEKTGDIDEEGEKSKIIKNDEVEDDEDNEDKNEHMSEHINQFYSYNTTEKISEIHIGGLAKAADEDDLIKIFAKFGEIKDARVARNSTTKKSKGFGFIRYASVEQAKSALLELKDGIEVRGKQASISACQGANTLYMGNICRAWRKDKVLKTLEGFGIQQVKEIHLPENDGKNKSYGFLEFESHTDAMAALQRLRKPDAIFGLARSAKVAFVPHPSEEVLIQMKTVYVEGLPDSWDEAKVKEICKQYGEIERVRLCKRKQKNFGFITFTSRESAVACVDGVNNSQVGEGEVQVKAEMAKALKGQFQMDPHGGFKLEKKSKMEEQTRAMKLEDHTKNKVAEQKVDNKQKAGPSSKGKQRVNEKDKDLSKFRETGKSRRTEKRGKELSKEKRKTLLNFESGKGNKLDRHQSSVSEGRGNGKSSLPERMNPKRKDLSAKLNGHGRKEVDHGYSKRPSKKARGDMRDMQGNMFGNPRSSLHFRETPKPVAYRDPYASRYEASTKYFRHANGASSGSKRHHSDMEPHAGFLKPAVEGKQGRPRARHEEPVLRTQSHSYTRYDEPHLRHVEPHLGRPFQRYPGYLEPTHETQTQHNVEYLDPGVGIQAQRPYGYDRIRLDEYYGQRSRGSVYAGGSALPPSYVPNYTSNPRYEQGGASNYYYPSSRSTQQPRATYY